MEALITAVLGELASRAISLLVDRRPEKGTAEQDLQRLQQLLLRLRVVAEEAEGRHVTNRAMICQLCMMMKQMFRGYYLLDTVKCREMETGDEEANRSSFAISKFNPAKRLHLLSSTTRIESMVIGRDNSKELKQVILSLESMVADMKEFIIFLMSYPRIYRQPYGAYLYLDKYMFGRQMEREQAISFLLQVEPQGCVNLGILPIVGPGLIGKSTLVEHVCDDERVRNHFSLILRYRGNDLKDETARRFRDHCVIKHQNTASGEGRSLVVIELLGDVDEGVWKRLLQTSEGCMAHGSKIIVTSRSEKMVSVGTTQAIKLNCLSKEAYWYFFKMLVFGSADPEHPKLTCIAMEIALQMCGSFIFAHLTATSLRANPRVRFWRRVLREAKEFMQKNNFVLGEYHEHHMSRYGWGGCIAETPRESEDRKLLLMHHSHQKCPAAQGDVPQKTILDLLCGTWNPMPQGKFDVLCWKSLIPPYYTYMYSCEFVQNKETGT